MTTNQIKKLLISKIDDTNDDELLRAVYKIMDHNSTPGNVYNLTNEQRTEVDAGLREIENGETVSDEELQKEIDKWLNE
ncbi:MAG TPA: hypothetical protein PKE39_01225 [Ignavibacteria bacterium]|nr:hypothetical protein [Ignavibacteria bacterium]HMQ97618.1 hypothetical protein [Ignavibacteria bacterium]